MKPVKFKGVYKDYIWGGTKMLSKYGVKTDLDVVAESWVLSCHKDGMSVIDGGEYDGLALDEYIAKNSAVLGTNCKWNELPILIKFIDAADNLSVQVHPNNEQAKAWENQNGKTEMWYVIEADEGAKITYGVKEDITKEQLASAISDNTVENLLNAEPSKKGDVFFVEAGTIHAIGSGNLIAEIQQNSNVTYRLYDYDRRGKDGKPRELHIEKGVKASKTTKIEPRNIPICSDGTRMVGSCEYFQVKELALSDKEHAIICDEKSYQTLVQTDGEALLISGGDKTVIKAGEAVFLPAGFGEYTVSGSGVMLIASNQPRYYVEIELDSLNVEATVVDEYGVTYAGAVCQNNELPLDIATCAKEAANASGILFDDIESVSVNTDDEIDSVVIKNVDSLLGKKVYIK